MSNVYKALAQNRVPDMIGINQAPGKLIMGNINVHQRTFGNLFDGFCNYFHAPLRWTWTGNPVTPPSAEILDGDRKTGQCLALARALQLLATTVQPHGCGLAPGTVGDPFVQGRYTGRYARGFISAHPIGGILGLMPNVIGTQNASIMLCGLVPLYAWADHKVVPWNGRFYDPSYRLIFNTLVSMATYHVKKEDDFLPGPEGVRLRALPGFPQSQADKFTIVDDHSGSVRYFRQLQPNECAAKGMPLGTLQGPY